MTRDDLAKLDTVNYEAAKKIIEAGKEQPPIIMCLPDGPFVAVGALMTEELGARGKDLVGRLITQLTKQYPIVCFICEAWAVHYDLNERQLDNVKPSAHPDRIEVVTCSYSSQELGYAIAHHPIFRQPDRVQLQRGELMYPTVAEGRFVA